VIPTRAVPEVVARVGVDRDPVDVTNADDARWLRACLWPDQPEQMARLEAELALAATAPPLLLQGAPVEVLPDALPRVPPTPWRSSPTLGDRRASGHSVIGLAVLDRSALRAEALGRCWSRGRLLGWLADP
jgi:hypothetical protein